MKVIIAGSRGCNNLEMVERAVSRSGFKITEVISGCAHGIDTMGERWAEKNGVPVVRFPAEWGKYGKAAGPIRNGQMAAYGEALIAVLAHQSKGTRNMILQMERLKKPIYVFNLPEGM